MVTLESLDADVADASATSTSRAARRELADAHKARGNACFASGAYEDAREAYTHALRVIGARDGDGDGDKENHADADANADADADDDVDVVAATYYANRAACALKVGDYASASADASRALALDATYTKAYARRAVAREALDDVEGALDDFQRVLEREKGDGAARRAVARLTPLVEAKRDAMKAEVVETMKNLGNSLLGNFGLSLDNFKAEKDPNTGSYSINFVNAPPRD